MVDTVYAQKVASVSSCCCAGAKGEERGALTLRLSAESSAVSSFPEGPRQEEPAPKEGLLRCEAEAPLAVWREAYGRTLEPGGPQPRLVRGEPLESKQWKLLASLEG